MIRSPPSSLIPHGKGRKKKENWGVGEGDDKLVNSNTRFA
jgi:hypothetical protein